MKVERHWTNFFANRGQPTGDFKNSYGVLTSEAVIRRPGQRAIPVAAMVQLRRGRLRAKTSPPELISSIKTPALATTGPTDTASIVEVILNGFDGHWPTRNRSRSGV